MAQHSFDFLKTARDVASRTGHSFALGCLHKYVGSLGSSQHLHTSVSILLALVQDNASPVVQCWSAHALALIADTGGPMFRDFVEPTLSCVIKLMLGTASSQTEVLVSVGRLLSAIITTLGPELTVSHPAGRWQWSSPLPIQTFVLVLHLFLPSSTIFTSKIKIHSYH